MSGMVLEILTFALGVGSVFLVNAAKDAWFLYKAGQEIEVVVDLIEETFAITHVLGEHPPGVLSLVVVDPKEIEYQKPTKIDLPIPPTFRPSANRILAGAETKDDISTLKALVEHHL